MNKIGLACVVDDDEIYTFTIKRIIARAEIAERTLFFQNGQSAFNYFKDNLNNLNEIPDLILLDLNMPVLDGWQFLDEFIKISDQVGKKITIYIVSSSIDEEDYNRAKSIQAVSDFIVKPLTHDDLFRILNLWQSER